MVEYKLVRKKNMKNIRIHVKPPTGEVVVSAPFRTSLSEIERALREKESWIVGAQARIAERQKLANGTNSDGKSGCGEDENEIPSGVLAGEWVPLSKTEEELLKLKIFRMAGHWEPIMGVHCTHWTIRYMKTRWGSCSVKKGTIRINAALARVDDDLLESVVVHELCHLLEASHNKRFYSLLTGFLPDYRERTKRLNKNG